MSYDDDVNKCLKCPHCGGNVQIVAPTMYSWYYCVCCIKCGSRTGEEKTIEEAIDVWNKRI